jgi:hypothetical protein
VSSGPWFHRPLRKFKKNLITKWKPVFYWIINSEIFSKSTRPSSGKWSEVIIVPTSYYPQTETLIRTNFWVFHEVCEQRVLSIVKKPSWKTENLRHPINSELLDVKCIHSKGYQVWILITGAWKKPLNNGNSGLSDAHTPNSNLILAISLQHLAQTQVDHLRKSVCIMQILLKSAPSKSRSP